MKEVLDREFERLTLDINSFKFLNFSVYTPKLLTKEDVFALYNSWDDNMELPELFPTIHLEFKSKNIYEYFVKDDNFAEIRDHKFYQDVQDGFGYTVDTKFDFIQYVSSDDVLIQNKIYVEEKHVRKVFLNNKNIQFEHIYLNILGYQFEGVRLAKEFGLTILFGLFRMNNNTTKAKNWSNIMRNLNNTNEDDE